MQDDETDGVSYQTGSIEEAAERILERIKNHPPQGEKEKRIRSLLCQIENELDRPDRFYPVYRRLRKYSMALTLFLMGLFLLGAFVPSPMLKVLEVVCVMLLFYIAVNREHISMQALRHEKCRLVRWLFIPKKLR